MRRIGGHPVLLLLIGAFLLVALFGNAEAVMVSSTTGNTTAPEDDFGFANVGVKSATTGIYLGYRWVLSADHTPSTDTTFNGQVYAYEEGTRTRLLNPTGMGLSTYTDLMLYRITEDPWLPSIKIAEDPVDVWDEVVMVGNGDNRANTLKSWDVSGDYGGDDWTWTVTDPPGDRQGYDMAGGRTVRWGTNRVEPGMYAIGLSATNEFLGFLTDFDQHDGTEHEAQAAPGDSGGGVFHKNGDQWELVGMMHAVSEFPNQPSRCIFGLETYCSDLSEYRDQIMQIITPLPGDANLDGVVDMLDASIMAANWGQTEGVLWGNGDFNEDGVIDTLDAELLAQGWGTSEASASGEAATPTVPEPSVFALMLGILIGLLVRRASGAAPAR